MRPVSVIVVSRGRPDALNRCLTGLSQLDYAPFEVIVVACPAGTTAVRARNDAEHIKLVEYDHANISAARNLGIAQASGGIVAFIDDDAVPEPLWLRHLTGPFDEGADAVGGFVIGRNGISFQWTARSIDKLGEAHPLDIEGDAPVIPVPPKGHAVKTEGTNMAIRRAALAQLGGFDEAFHFYLDESDLNLRLLQAGLRTAISPLAQVHHGFAESARRSTDRTPRDLYEIGASQRVFLLKHAPGRTGSRAWKAFRAEQRLRLLRLMQRGPLGADDVARLLHGLRKGGRDGAKRSFGQTPALGSATADFLPYPSHQNAPRIVLSGRPWQAGRLREEAAASAGNGAIVSLYLFSRTALYHTVRYNADGFWQQSGGLFGRSERRGTFFRIRSFRSRLKREIERTRRVRGDTTPRPVEEE